MNLTESDYLGIGTLESFMKLKKYNGENLVINERKVLEKMITLPEQFQKRMSEMLGTTYQEFLESYNSPRQYGLRVNTLKNDRKMVWRRCKLFRFYIF